MELERFSMAQGSVLAGIHGAKYFPCMWMFVFKVGPHFIHIRVYHATDAAFEYVTGGERGLMLLYVVMNEEYLEGNKVQYDS